MKSKMLTYNQTQSRQTTTVANRNRSTVKCPNNRYSTVLIDEKIVTNIENEKDICNNNTEEVFNDGDFQVDQTSVTNNALTNNNEFTSEIVEVKESEDDFLDDINHTSYSPDLQQFNTSGNPSDDSGGTDHFAEPDNSVDIEEECHKSCGSVAENKTNLIVNYLPQNMSQEEMRTLFSTIGDVESCKLIRDKPTGQSLSYGFVNYHNAVDANNAIRKFNGMRLQNKVIKVSLARPSSDTIKGANLYICGLPKSMTQTELEKLFSQCGTIITCRILMDNTTGNSKGVAFIRFDRRQEAEAAITDLNGHTPANGTEPITVKLANTPFNINISPNSIHNSDFVSTSQNNSVSHPPSASRCIMPTSRSMVTTCSDIIPIFDGNRSSSAIMGPEYVHPSGGPIPTNHQLGFPSGHMVCSSQMHPMAAFSMSYPCLQSLPGSQGPSAMQTNQIIPVNGNHTSSQFISIDPILASTHLMESNLCGLSLYNLSPDTKEGSLWQTFGPYGAVNSVNITRDPTTGKCRGIGFTTMPNYHEAILAAQQLNGNPLENRILQISMSPVIKMSDVNQYGLPSMAP